ncbi:MAG: glycosyltransferase family 2 protein [Elusimicrobiota bacterium]|jgi:hypothetical protein
MPLVSVVIRAKNEERWVGRCLRMVFRQDFKDFEVVFVDNESTDHTLAIASKFPVKTVSLSEFLPGKAINAGIRASRGEFIACLSAHCIPHDKHWLSRLHANFADPAIAGVYGRQLPMSYSSDLDKRDLINTFGLDHRIQVKDSFFHNANSMFRRSVWERIPFDEAATNIEDRIWGKAVVAAGLRLAYEPEAAVYHHHGIHQGGDEERARNVVRILESLTPEDERPSRSEAHKLDILAILPVLGPLPVVAGQDLLERCIRQVRACGLVGDVAVIAEDASALDTARRAGARPLPRPAPLGQTDVGAEQVLQYALAQCETGERHYDAVLYVNCLHPFRPEGFFDDLLGKFSHSDFDSVVPTMKDYVAAWSDSGGRIVRSDAGFQPHGTKKPFQRGLVGLGTVSRSEFIRRGQLLGEAVALVPLEDKLCSMRANDPFDRAVIKIALEQGSSLFRT